ncbi:FecR family protein [Pedobacter frigoris]|uniref:FecR family protein n=1 Tax=Pedobacter frigoris TaxID=2571272 RepID=UPI00292FC6D3|nr:FecR domain-containing protein [Pedobacter frigoris]
MEQFETNEEFIYSLIIDDLDGTISETDKVILEQWRKTADENERTYNDFRNIQLGIDKLYSRQSADPQLSWEALDHKIASEPTVVKSGNIKMWYKIAAAVLVILSVGYYFMLDSRYVVIRTEDNAAITHVVLPDGTDINLNAATAVRYNKADFLNNRKLELLKGEVFIHVTNHDLKSQFRVAMGEVEAQDIGTSFNVEKQDGKIAVIVEAGIVALKHAPTGKQVVLDSGKLGVYNEETKELSTLNNSDLNYKAWIDRKFTFMEIPLADVAKQMEKVYLIPISIKGDALKNKKLTARLHYQTLDSVLAVISASLQCKVTKEKDNYVLSDK